MNKTAIFYGSSTGNTANIAGALASALGADAFDVAKNPGEKIAEYSLLIFGTSTWGLGDLQDDWDGFLSQVEKADLSEKTIALFGLGDAASYPDSFVDGMGIIYEAIKDKGCTIVGAVNAANYDFDASRAEYDGKFVGLALDEDNDSNLTDDRLSAWVQEIKPYFS